MEILEVKTLSCIKEGDLIIITGDTLYAEPLKALCVKISERDGVEVIFDLKKNRFFNVGMYLEGKSWVKDVHIIR
jgi:hypothetical protein